MKHYLPILSALVILFSSCSKEDDLFEDPIIEVPTLCVKRTVDYSSEWSVDTKIYDYNYEGTKLIDWTYTSIRDNETSTVTYTNLYQNDVITGMIVANDNSTDYYEFERDLNNRVTKQIKNGSEEFTWIYSGLVVAKFNDSGDLIEEQTYDGDYNLIKNKYKDGSDTTWTSIYENTHDNKNMPFMNVHSWYPLSPYRYVSPNNTTSITTILSNSSFNPPGSVMSMDISYGIDDFPTSIYTTYSDGKWKSETLEYNN
jgi:hypothetical protein|tara:strand:- start:60 stop:827 length:768 start_codon:yes stop_codon:yes gene_type:complete